MNAEVFAEWLQRQGYHVARTESSYWYNAGPRVYQAFPYHWVIEPQEEELLSFLRRNRAIALRYSTPLTAAQGKLSYHVVCEGPSFDFASLPRKVRQDINKGLEYAAVEHIPVFRLATEGWNLRSETLIRQGRTKAENQTWWRRMCQSAQDLPGFEAWGAIHDGQLVASFLACTCDSCYTLLYHQSATAHLRNGINNAIFYSVTAAALSRPGISQVFVALHSLDASPDVDRFKFRMRYTTRPIRQRVVFHPSLSLVLDPVNPIVTRLIRHWSPETPALAKVKGMLRFYLDGKLPLDKQNWPEILLNAKADVMGSASATHGAQE
ncbi:MAG: hypothetical protein NT169_20935 [Chloroflexi bacterium]|nr:hypothetical protein [Chloroflexota bacterium]